jgi:hypothetical protein
MQLVILPYNVQHNHIITIFVDYGTNQERK